MISMLYLLNPKVQKKDLCSLTIAILHKKTQKVTVHQLLKKMITFFRLKYLFIKY